MRAGALYDVSVASASSKHPKPECGASDVTDSALELILGAGRATLEIANTEEHLAATFDQIAERAPARAEHLNSVAAHARAHAGSEHEIAGRANDDDST